MLASNSADSPATSTADTAMTVPQQPAPAAAPPAEAPAYNHEELEDLVNMIVSSPEFKDAFDFSSPSMDPEQYLTSPMPALGHDFDEPSPKETPLNDLLSTPLFENTDSPPGEQDAVACKSWVSRLVLRLLDRSVQDGGIDSKRAGWRSAVELEVAIVGLDRSGCSSR